MFQPPKQIGSLVMIVLVYSCKDASANLSRTFLHSTMSFATSTAHPRGLFCDRDFDRDFMLKFRRDLGVGVRAVFDPSQNSGLADAVGVANDRQENKVHASFKR